MLVGWTLAESRPGITESTVMREMSKGYRKRQKPIRIYHANFSSFDGKRYFRGKKAGAGGEGRLKVSGAAEWLESIEQMAYGLLELKPRELDRLQPHEFEKMLEGYVMRRDKQNEVQAYFTYP